MSLVQMQRVRSYANGDELVTYAENHELTTHREYAEALAPLDHQCRDDEFTRTVGEGSPLWVSFYVPTEDDEQ